MMPQVPSGPSSSVANPYSVSSPVNAFPANSSPYTSTNLLTGTGTTPGTTPAPTGAGSYASGATGVSPLGASLGIPTTNTGENKTLKSLNATFGAGLGTAIYNFLAGGAGFNQSAVNNLIAALQPGYEQSQQDLLTEFSGGGNRFSSGAQIGLSNLASQEQLNIGSLESQMYEQSVDDFINVLMGASSASANRKANQATTWDAISSAIGLGSSAASGAEAGLSAAGSGSGGIASTLAGLAAL